MWGIYLTVQITRFVCAIVISIVVGLIVSTVLGALAWHAGYNADQVFNVSGLIGTGLAFWGVWQLSDGS
ncbi:MAG: hypothetical protein Kow0047_09520 [Anaerolineae bacterium]